MSTFKASDRDALIEAMARAMNQTGLAWQSDMLDTDALIADARNALAAIEAVGVTVDMLNTAMIAASPYAPKETGGE